MTDHNAPDTPDPEDRSSTHPPVVGGKEDPPPGGRRGNHGLHKLSTATLVIAALGVVFGDIGTSPIYTLKECFSPASPHHIAATHGNILGVVSLVLWALILLICVKYLVYILRADNKGEGGVLSLMVLAAHGMTEQVRRRARPSPLPIHPPAASRRCRCCGAACRAWRRPPRRRCGHTR